MTTAALALRLPSPDFLRAPPPRVTRRYAVHVARGQTQALPPAEGRQVVHCRSGSVWITHDGDPKDVILGANESYAVDRSDRMTVHALHGDSALEVQIS